MSLTGRLLLVLLVVDAAVLAVIELFYLPLRLGPSQGGAMLPLSILLAAVSTPLLVRAAGQLVAPRLAVAGAPLGVWLLTVLVFGVAGPGGDVMLPVDTRSLLLLAAGVLPAGVVLGRMVGRELAASGPGSGGSSASEARSVPESRSVEESHGV